MNRTARSPWSRSSFFVNCPPAKQRRSANRRIDDRFSSSVRLPTAGSWRLFNTATDALRGIVLLTALALHAQAQTASLSGSVADAWEISVPNVALTLTNSQTGDKLNATSNPAGDYAFSKIAPGSYDLSIRMDGFKPYARRNLEFRADAKDGATPHLYVALDREKEETGGDIKEFETQVAAKRDDYLAHFNLARAYLAKGKSQDALNQFQESLKLHPDDRVVKLALARMAIRAGVPAYALQVARELLALKSDDRAALLMAASAFVVSKQPDEAAEPIGKLLKTDPFDTDALIESGSVNLQLKRYPEAEAAFRRAYAFDPTDIRGIRGLADVYFVQKEPEKAVHEVAEEVKKAPDRANLRKELGTTELRAKEYDKAVADFSAVLEKFHDKPKEQADIYAAIGRAYQAKGDLANSQDNLKKATQLAPDNAGYLNSLATVCDAAGKTNEAITAYNQALRIDPQNASAMNNLAYLMAKSGGNLDDALRLVQLARRQLPNVAEVMDTLGWIYLKKDLVSSACQVFQDLTEKAPANSTYHYHYALALSEKGDKAAARQQLDLALQNKPDKQVEEQIQELMKKLS